MNNWALLGLNTLAVALAGISGTLTTWQVNGHDWTSALVAGGVTTCIAGLGQLAKAGVVSNLAGPSAPPKAGG